MDRNERTHPFSEAFVESLRSRITGELAMTYPEPGPLYDRFSSWLSLDRDQLLFHSGSDLAIKAVFETYISAGDKILLHLPGYAMYKVYANMFQANAEFMEYDADLRFDIDSYTDRLDGSYRMVVLENPNGFTGNAHRMDAILRLAEKAQKHGVILLADEAYFHFIDETAADLIGRFDNLIVVRTFSKAFGLAGLRAAYLLSQRRNIENLYKVKPMHELNAAAIAAIDTLLDHEGEFSRFIAETAVSREHLARGLNSLGVRTSESRANFLAAKFGPALDGAAVSDHLKQFGFLIRRPFREKHLKDWSRVGTLPIAQQTEMLSHLREHAERRQKTQSTRP
ncbi:MAG TPA: histidinol-phosphate transaminase [Fimbriimonadaceae bacterium]|nr:histidinol-phosphate transaminase [Fimbriimonadaceae bacterium]